MRKATTSFFRGILQKWWWIVTGLVGGLQSVASITGIESTIPWYVGIAVLAVCLLIASFLSYCDLYARTEAQQQRNLVLSKPKGKFIHSSHRMSIWEVSNQMDTIHGHVDDDGLEADVRDGVLVGDLMTRPCTRCGNLRNEKGGTAC